MQLRSRSALFLCIILSSITACIGQSAQDLFRKNAPAVVLIEVVGDDGQVKATGTGFLVVSDGKILTNFHVVAHAKRATVRLFNDDAYDDVEVLDVDKRKDIAVLKIKAVGLPTVSLGESSSVQVGDSVFSLSNPLGVLQNSLSSGIISGIRSMDGYKCFQVSTPISQGSSGGPLFNSSGQVIGLTSALIPEGQNLNFAVPIDYAKGMLANLGQPKSLASIYEPEPAQEPENSNPSAPVNQPQQQVAPSSNISADAVEELRKQGPFTYLPTKFGQWQIADATRTLGAPVRQTATNGTDVYVFADPTNLFREIALFFSPGSKTLNNIALSPWNLSWRQCKETLGDKYWKKKNDNGTVSYMFKDRPVNVLVDGREEVINIGVYCNSCH